MSLSQLRTKSPQLANFSLTASYRSAHVKGQVHGPLKNCFSVSIQIWFKNTPETDFLMWYENDCLYVEIYLIDFHFLLCHITSVHKYICGPSLLFNYSVFCSVFLKWKINVLSQNVTFVFKDVLTALDELFFYLKFSITLLISTKEYVFKSCSCHTESLWKMYFFRKLSFFFSWLWCEFLIICCSLMF